MENYRLRVENFLKGIIPNNSLLTEAMRYATEGGKKLRASLVYSSAECFGVKNVATLDFAAAAVECIHAYSLIHDDLPCMDNDDLRRGKPSTHKKFGEAQALLAGDALNTFAFELLAISPVSPEIKIHQIEALAGACGFAGMVLGQSLDILHTGENLEAEKIYEIHEKKTAALITACLKIGAATSEQYPEYIQVLEYIGNKLGTAYQIADDLLDNQEGIGKTTGKDKQQGKNSFANLENPEKILADLEKKIILSINSELPNPQPLLKLINPMLRRGS